MLLLTRRVLLNGLMFFNLILEGNMQHFTSFQLANRRLISVLYSDVAASGIECCCMCNKVIGCNSLSYQETTKECLLSEVTYPNVIKNSLEDENWKTYSRKEWLLLFRAVAGKGMSGISWLEGLPVELNEPGCRDPENMNCSYFRHYFTDSWSSIPHKKVKYSLYKTGQEVAFIIFNGTGSMTLEDWFMADKVLNYSWSSLNSALYNGSFVVDGSIWDDHQRWFYILTSSGSCELDGGYIVTLMAYDICHYDHRERYPQFLYSKNNMPSLYESTDMEVADYMTISISLRPNI